MPRPKGHIIYKASCKEFLKLFEALKKLIIIRPKPPLKSL